MKELRDELINYLDQIKITSQNIGHIRQTCCVPWDSEWNSIVRTETAERENK